MESLHLTYEETVRKIPYRTLILMTKDKQHSTDAEVWEEMTPEEEEKFLQSKMKG